ncbi:MAG: DNRLRE domain-containing protein [Candidatus Schekmanbacteria bacterium]|nr:DNRLRE domain-containing protein [Candidatus Schekmanbacteria bacterium]
MNRTRRTWRASAVFPLAAVALWGALQVCAAGDAQAATAEPVRVVIQREVGGAVADALLNSGVGSDGAASRNYGRSGSLTASLDGSGGRRHGLLRFDLSAVPQGVTITSATIHLNLLLYGGAPVHAHLVTSSWSESTVSWASFAGAYSPDVTVTFPAASVTSADVTELVQDWLDGATANYGILLERDIAGVTVFASSEIPHAAARPRLDIIYVPGPCTGKADGTSCDDGKGCANGSGDVCAGGICRGQHQLITWPTSDERLDFFNAYTMARKYAFDRIDGTDTPMMYPPAISKKIITGRGTACPGNAAYCDFGHFGEGPLQALTNIDDIQFLHAVDHEYFPSVDNTSHKVDAALHYKRLIDYFYLNGANAQTLWGPYVTATDCIDRVAAPDQADVVPTAVIPCCALATPGSDPSQCVGEVGASAMWVKSGETYVGYENRWAPDINKPEIRSRFIDAMVENYDCQERANFAWLDNAYYGARPTDACDGIPNGNTPDLYPNCNDSRGNAPAWGYAATAANHQPVTKKTAISFYHDLLKGLKEVGLRAMANVDFGDLSIADTEPERERFFNAFTEAFAENGGAIYLESGPLYNHENIPFRTRGMPWAVCHELNVYRRWLDAKIPVVMGANLERGPWVAALAMAIRNKGDSLFVRRDQGAALDDVEWRLYPEWFGAPDPYASPVMVPTDHWAPESEYAKQCSSELVLPNGGTPALGQEIDPYRTMECYSDSVPGGPWRARKYCDWYLTRAFLNERRITVVGAMYAPTEHLTAPGYSLASLLGEDALGHDVVLHGLNDGEWQADGQKATFTPDPQGPQQPDPWGWRHFGVGKKCSGWNCESIIDVAMWFAPECRPDIDIIEDGCTCDSGVTAQRTCGYNGRWIACSRGCAPTGTKPAEEASPEYQ